MDPYYFMDIEIEENEEDLELHEFTNYGPDGCWNICCEDYKIIYDNNSYTEITFDNSSKLISFYEDDKLLLQYKLVLEKKNITTI